MLNQQEIKKAIKMVALTNNVSLSLVEDNIFNLINGIGSEPNRREVQSFRDKLRNLVRNAQSVEQLKKPAVSADAPVLVPNTRAATVFAPESKTQICAEALNAVHRTDKRTAVRRYEKGNNVWNGKRLLVFRSQKRYPNAVQIRKQAAIRAARVL